jgi:WD40 repeat protein
MNCQFNADGDAVYPTAALGVVFDYKSMTQKYFGGGKTDFGGRKQDDESKDGHSDDVTALCMSFSRKMVASGQNGQKPLVFLWDAATAKPICSKRLPKGARLVTAIGVSATDKYIAAADAAEKITVHIFDINGGKAAIASVAVNMKIVHLAWSPCDEMSFATAGKDHVALCVFDGKKSVKMSKGKAGKGGKIESQCSAAWLNDKKYSNHIITGGSDGCVYHWTGDSVTKKYENNKGSVHSVACRTDPKAGGEVVLVGGNDKTLTVYKFDGKLSKLW